MLINYKHSEIDEIIECELDFYPDEPEVGFMVISFELVSAKIKGVDISPILHESIIDHIVRLAIASKE
jgi:hypothetical protein